MIHLTAKEAQQRLPELLVAASTGEIVEITENGSTFQLTVVEPQPSRSRPAVTGVPKAGRLKSQLVVPDDFDEPLEEMREYME